MSPGEYFTPCCYQYFNSTLFGVTKEWLSDLGNPAGIPRDFLAMPVPWTHLSASLGPPCFFCCGLKWGPALVHPGTQHSVRARSQDEAADPTPLPATANSSSPVPCPANPLEINHLPQPYKCQAQPGAFLFHNAGLSKRSGECLVWQLLTTSLNTLRVLSRKQFLGNGHDFLTQICSRETQAAAATPRAAEPSRAAPVQ